MKASSPILQISLLIGGFLLSTGLLQAEPWPAYDPHSLAADYVKITPAYDSQTTLWTYSISIDSNATDPSYGAISGVKAMAVHPYPTPDNQWNPENYVALPAGWDIDGGWEGKAFGYRTVGSAYYVRQGETEKPLGTIKYPDSGYVLEGQAFLVQVIFDAGPGYWMRPTVAPEPSSLLALGMGAVGLAGFIRRRMWK